MSFFTKVSVSQRREIPGRTPPPRRSTSRPRPSGFEGAARAAPKVHQGVPCEDSESPRDFGQVCKQVRRTGNLGAVLRRFALPSPVTETAAGRNVGARGRSGIQKVLGAREALPGLLM